MRSLSSPILFLSFSLAAMILASFVSASEKIDINTAPMSELVKIIHIGEARAEELISLRPFSSLDSLSRIRGISTSRVNDIKKQGLAWISDSDKIETIKVQEKQEELLTIEDIAKASVQPTSSSPFVFLVAIAIAVFSGTIVLILKRKSQLR